MNNVRAPSVDKRNRLVIVRISFDHLANDGGLDGDLTEHFKLLLVF
jgi:hypothetical protein